MLEITDIPISPEQGATVEGCLEAGKLEAEKLLGCQPFDIASIALSHRSVDTRRKRRIQILINVRLELRAGLDERGIVANLPVQTARRISVIQEEETSFPPVVGVDEKQVVRPVIVGAGLAGTFAALALAEAGLEPILIERGKDSGRRADDVRRLAETGEPDPDSNFRFGLGGRGVFSGEDLGPNMRDPDHRLVLKTLIEAGAPESILWDEEPRIESDVFPDVIANLMVRIEEHGGEIRPSTRLIGIDRALDGSIRNITMMADGREESLLANRLVLACGPAAFDVYEILDAIDVRMDRKTFAMGVRVEHLQEDVDRMRYGTYAKSGLLGPASYSVTARCGNGRSLSTSAMCPGGNVVAAATDNGSVSVGGACEQAHEGRNACAALMVNINPRDLEAESPLAGVELQRTCEQKAFELGGGGQAAPVQLMGDFLAGKPSAGAGRVEATYPCGTTWTSLDDALPSFVTETLRQGIPALDRKLHGFNDGEAVLTGVETRSSSPVTIVRGDDFQALGTPGLYPCGEGAGYANSLVGAAADGIRCARAIIDSLPAYLKRRDVGELPGSPS